MKLITPSLLKFTATILALTILFRHFLSASIAVHSSGRIIVTAVVYGLCMFLSGFYFGGKESRRLPISDVGFRFHLATYIVVIGVSELWFVLGLNAPGETVTGTNYTALIWGVLLVLHFVYFLIARRHTIKYIDKRELFE